MNIPSDDQTRGYPLWSSGGKIKMLQNCHAVQVINCFKKDVELGRAHCKEDGIPGLILRWSEFSSVEILVAWKLKSLAAANTQNLLQTKWKPKIFSSKYWLTVAQNERLCLGNYMGAYWIFHCKQSADGPPQPNNRLAFRFHIKKQWFLWKQ